MDSLGTLSVDTTLGQSAESPTEPETEAAPLQLSNIYPELRIIPPSTAPIHTREQEDLAASYRRITLDDLAFVGNAFSVPPGDPTQPIRKTFDIPGDHIYVSEMDGTITWGVRIGPDTNPIIVLREGMTIKRKFRSLTFFTLDASGIGAITAVQVASEFQRSRVEIYVSTGELAISAPNRYGLGPATIGRIDCVATTTTRLFAADYPPVDGLGNPLEQLTLGRGGATLFIRNSDLTNELIIVGATYSGTYLTTFGTNLFRLYPGEVLTLELDGRAVDFVDGSGLSVKCAAGTCKYDWWCTRRSSDQPTIANFVAPY